MLRKIVYIAGYGRSGSTLLERILATHPQIEGLGEVSSLFRVLEHENARCSCGAPILQCPVWGPALSRFQRQSGEQWGSWAKIQKHFEAVPFGGVFSFFQRDLHQKYCSLLQQLFDNISKSAPNVTTLIDSSKTAWPTAWRPLQLDRCLPVPVKVIHLVRDVRGCMWSNIRLDNLAVEQGRSRGVPLASIRTAIHWPVANITAQMYQYHCPHNYFRVRYEDFVASPETIVASIGDFLEMDLSEQISLVSRMRSQAVILPRTHQISGNRLRFRDKFRIHGDFSWQVSLRWYHRLLASLFGGLLSRKYGYK